MYRWITTIAAIVLLIAAVGLYRGWFTLSRSQTPASNNAINVNLKVDGDKIKRDVDFTRDAPMDPAK
jgi:flagellar basal body-associated protein FliL